MKNIEYGTEFLDQLKDRVHDLYDENKELKKEIERLNNDIKILLQENENKEKVIKAQDNIINKAIEYIEYYLAKGKTKNHRKFDISVLDILKGVDKE